MCNINLLADDFTVINVNMTVIDFTETVHSHVLLVISLKTTIMPNRFDLVYV